MLALFQNRTNLEKISELVLLLSTLPHELPEREFDPRLQR
jgi:hypothetical protein